MRALRAGRMLMLVVAALTPGYVDLVKPLMIGDQSKSEGAMLRGVMDWTDELARKNVLPVIKANLLRK